MNHPRMLLWLLLAMLSLTACDSNDDEDTELIGNWSKSSQFEGLARSGAVCFTIGDKAYVGLGTDGTDEFKDFWEYDPSLNTWRQRADFPGVARYQAAGFAVNGKGYVGTGYDGVNRLNDFWEFNPATNTWTRKADFAGSARYGAVGLEIAGKGYLGTGHDGNTKKDFWQYDPTTDQWTQKASFGGDKRLGALAFTINGTGYILAGSDNALVKTDIWAYDPTTERWTERRRLEVNDSDDEGDDYDYSAVPRLNGVAFVVNSLAYVTGGTNSGSLSSCWAYDPTSDTWTEKSAFEGATRTLAVGFGLGDRGYIGTGTSGSTRLDDFWMLAPNDENQ